MKKFIVLLKKEIRELLTPQMLIPLVMIVAVFYFIGQVAGKESQKIDQTKTVGIMDLDKTPSSQEFASILMQQGFAVEQYDDVDRDLALIKAKEQGKKAFVYIPRDFESNLQRDFTSTLEVFYMIRGFSITSASKMDLTPALRAANAAYSQKLLAQVAPNADIQKISNPLQVQSHTIVRDKTADVSIGEVTGFISSQATFIPIVLVLVITFAANLIATSIAQEKENKTLETLLSSPIPRSAIVGAKLVAAGLIALLSAAFYMYGLNSYISGLSGGADSDSGINFAAIEQLGINLNTADYLLLGGVIFLGILAALSIALILGSFAEDTKSAQGVMSPLMVLIMIPYFLVFFLDINTISPALKWLVYAIPFSHVFMAAPNIMLGQYQPVVYGMLYLAGLFVFFIWIASKIFATDKILTMKFKFGKNK